MPSTIILKLLVLISIAGIGQAQMNDAAELIMRHNDMSFLYQLLALMAAPQMGGDPDGQGIVTKFATCTERELTRVTGTQRQPLSEAQQIGILAAQHTLMLEKRLFLMHLHFLVRTRNQQLFTRQQRAALSQSAARQLRVMTATEQLSAGDGAQMKTIAGGDVDVLNVLMSQIATRLR